MENFEHGIVGTDVGAVSLESGLKNRKSLEIARPFDFVFWPHSVEKVSALSHWTLRLRPKHGG